MKQQHFVLHNQRADVKSLKNTLKIGSSLNYLKNIFLFINEADGLNLN